MRVSGTNGSVTNFYPRSPRGERRTPPTASSASWDYFYPRSPRGERLLFAVFLPGKSRFLSTLPARGATFCPGRWSWLFTPFLSTLPARGATIGFHSVLSNIFYFYPRSPRGERHLAVLLLMVCNDFYPRSPRGERLAAQRLLPVLYSISIHAPREGSDRELFVSASESMEISIHAPREGSDKASPCGPPCTRYFYPRSPRGERPAAAGPLVRRLYFYPRSPRGERPAPPCPRWGNGVHFYPRSPRGERPVQPQSIARKGDFYPRSPRGERPIHDARSQIPAGFLSTLPARGATRRSNKQNLLQG